MKSKFIEKQIKFYKSIKPCFCPALKETVYFASEGLHHLLYKRRRPRKQIEQHYRVSLLPHVVSVITNATKAIKSISEFNITTWSLEHKIKKTFKKYVIKVILKKDGEGRLSFLSVMEKNHKNKKT